MKRKSLFLFALIVAPLEKDGDDSDYELGPMDENGNLNVLAESIDETFSITSDTNWSQIRHLYFSYRIPSGVTLTINNDVYFVMAQK